MRLLGNSVTDARNLARATLGLSPIPVSMAPKVPRAMWLPGTVWELVSNHVLRVIMGAYKDVTSSTYPPLKPLSALNPNLGLYCTRAFSLYKDEFQQPRGY
jgi:hypothetical protein